MAGKCLIGAGAAGFLIASLVPAMALANNLNVNAGTHIPMRPHVNLNATINLDVKSRMFRDIDLSDTCRADERIKTKGKREWRCRQDR
ncbi:hypothetical protein YH63_017485 [Afipia massiliensis]|uniref:Uncharacterized protein n=1 Tax=Afipia massiliensis TaxID=211460 RepID=A0A4U6BSV8_9BRAD|nr:hypothetical protein [Afipia massiliensis]TKT73071.1 hypothetical protein YH63_017485 [Afipia massiliensis]